MGGAQFCLKACDPSYENGWAMCEHIFDRIGCVYNAPSNWSKINGTFESCKGDDQLYPGQYVEGGVTRTYTHSSSECTPYTSSSIYTAGRQFAVSTSSASSTASSSTITSGASSSSGSPSETGAAASASRA